MKCYQCERPAMYLIGKKNIPLCIYCNKILEDQRNIEFVKNAIMMNNSIDQMDSITGIPTIGGRINLAPLAKAMQGNPTLNNFHISQSQIGVLNTGTIARIDSAITQSQGSNAEEPLSKLKEFAQLIIDSNEIDSNKKNEILEITETLSEQISGPQRMSSITALMKSIKEHVQGVAVLAAAANGLWDVIAATLS